MSDRIVTMIDVSPPVSNPVTGFNEQVIELKLVCDGNPTEASMLRLYAQAFGFDLDANFWGPCAVATKRITVVHLPPRIIEDRK